MRKIALTLTAILFVFASSLSAQNSNNEGNQTKEERQKEQIQKKVDEMDKIVDLTDDQATQIFDLYMESQNKVQAERANVNTQEEMKALRQKTNKATNKKVMELLTDEQREKLKAEREKKKAERENNE